MAIARAKRALSASHRFALPVLPGQLRLVGVRYLDPKYGGKRRFLHEFFRLISVFAQSSNVDHVGRSILKSSELSFDRFDLIALLLIHNTCLQDLERL